VLADPIEQCSFEADIITQALGFYPFMPEDLLTLGEKFLIEARLLYEFVGRLIGL